MKIKEINDIQRNSSFALKKLLAKPGLSDADRAAFMEQSLRAELLYTVSFALEGALTDAFGKSAHSLNNAQPALGREQYAALARELLETVEQEDTRLADAYRACATLVAETAQSRTVIKQLADIVEPALHRCLDTQRAFQKKLSAAAPK